MRDLHGGIAAWEGAGLPVEKDPPIVRAEAAPPGRAPAVLGALGSVRSLLAVWFVINLVCGFAYWGISFLPAHGLREQGQPLAVGANRLLEAVYFSFVTGLSIGFGDIVPVGAARVLAVGQGAVCLLLFGAIISKLVSGRQEQLTEEIHRVAFEERLGRVRTNLHLVVSEIQDLAEGCARSPGADERIVRRLESAAAIFAGELRTVHDLLYRPQTTPAEDVLESILAHVDGGLREFTALLSCFPPERRATPALVTNVRSIAGLANEICGECVPREHAPHLKAWMDRIQERSRALAA